MLKNQLGNSELSVSEIAFGCMSLGDEHGENARLLHRALDGGINFFDTADLYQQGFNEESLGRAFKGMRHRAVIATKVGNEWRPDGSGWDWNPSKAYILKAVEGSLRRLQTDYIDLYQLHGGTLEDPIDDTISAFEQLVQEGKIRYYGISSIRPNVIREWAARSRMVSVMMQYSLLDRRPEETCFGLLQEKNISVIVRGALAKGLLAGKTPTAYLEHGEASVRKVYQVVQAFTQPGQATAHTALRYARYPEAVATIALGIRNGAQLDTGLRFPLSPALSPEEWAEIQDSTPLHTYPQHR